MRLVGPEEARALVDAGARLVDLRSPASHIRERLPYSVNATIDALEKEPIAQNLRLVVYAEGALDPVTTGRLETLAARVTDLAVLEDGLAGWIEAGHPIVDTATPWRIVAGFVALGCALVGLLVEMSVEAALVASIGFVAGLLSGVLGPLVPLSFLALFGLSEAHRVLGSSAAALAIAAFLPVCLSLSRAPEARGQILFHLGGGVPGALVFCALALSLSPVGLAGTTLVLATVLAGLALVRIDERQTPIASGSRNLCLGALSGGTTALVGIGLARLFEPVLHLAAGTTKDGARAVASTGVFVFSAAVATTFAIAGHVDWAIVAPYLVGSLLAYPVARDLAAAYSGWRRLERGVAIVVFPTTAIAALALLWSA